MKAYYFATKERRLRYDDNRAITVGTTHKVAGVIKLCSTGLHASLTPFDALQYAPGPILYLVRLSGAIVQGDDKCAASERTYLAEYDATALLRSYARWCALRHVEKIKPYCSDAECATVVAYLNTGDEALREAARAASEAARAASEAAWAASEAARAASEAAWAARAASWAASEAAWAARAARAASDSSALAVLEAASEAARATVWSAERDALADKFNSMVADATGWEV